jgi:ABC-type transport system substrate-binding protein
VDKIELTMGVDPQQQASAIAFGQADVVELPASEVRRAAQRGVRTVSSDPVELYALQFDITRAAVQDVRIRQAISLSIDRSSIADVILQRQAVVAGSLLPNWISGYSHLFSVAADLPRAKDLLTATGREVSHPAPLMLIYDSGDEEAHAVADRVAFNLKEGGITVQVAAQQAGGKSIAADMRLVRRHISLPDPGIALADLLNSSGESAATMETLEQIYAAERAPIDAFRIIPIVHVSESYGLSPQVRDWLAPRWGGWRLEDVWLGVPQASAGVSQ